MVFVVCPSHQTLTAIIINLNGFPNKVHTIILTVNGILNSHMLKELEKK